jgi:2-polyprenyl-3-methyl-5-hydroxy-6-metoxy-1,4-benzoquinol methylase
MPEHRLKERQAKEGFYDTIAETFDAVMNRFDLDRRIEIVFDRLLGAIELRGKLLLDVGAGTGPFSLVARDRGASVISLDLGGQLLRVARGKGIQQPVVGDACALPLAHDSVDVVISSECIEHTPSPRTAVSEMLRVLRPGGSLALTCPNRRWRWAAVVGSKLHLRPYQGLENWPTWEELEKWIDEAGGRIIRHVGLHALPFQLPFAKATLPRIDQAAARLGAYFVNQCVLAHKSKVLR